MLSCVCVSVCVSERDVLYARHMFACESDISYVCKFMNVCMHIGVALLSPASHRN